MPALAATPPGKHGGAQLFSFGETGEKVAHHGRAQSRHDIRQIYAQLLFMHHVRFGKNGAAAGNAHGILAAQGQGAKLIDGNAQPMGLLIQKGAGTRGTRCSWQNPPPPHPSG